MTFSDSVHCGANSSKPAGRLIRPHGRLTLACRANQSVQDRIDITCTPSAAPSSSPVFATLGSKVTSQMAVRKSTPSSDSRNDQDFYWVPPRFAVGH